MIIVRWLCDEPLRFFLVGIVVMIMFAIIQWLLCMKIERKLLKGVPTILLAFISAFIILLALDLFHAQSDGLANVNLLLATLFSIPVISAFIGVAIGWFASHVFTKQRNR